MTTVTQIERTFELLNPRLNERPHRLGAAAAALAIGHGGLTRVAVATRLDVRTLRAGIRTRRDRAAGQPDPLQPGPRRRPGAGRTRRPAEGPTRLRDLEALVEPLTRGDPASPLRWTCTSTETRARERRARGHTVSPRTVAARLHGLGYRLQGGRKAKAGQPHPDPDARFRLINDRAEAARGRGQPVISVDTKTKERIGDVKNGGREWPPAYQPVRVATHAFPGPRLGKRIPYAVYDLAEDAGWVSGGTDHATAAFAVASMRRWWRHVGRRQGPRAGEVVVTADAGAATAAATGCGRWRGRNRPTRRAW